MILISARFIAENMLKNLRKMKILKYVNPEINRSHPHIQTPTPTHTHVRYQFPFYMSRLSLPRVTKWLLSMKKFKDLHVPFTLEYIFFQFYCSVGVHAWWSHFASLDIMLLQGGNCMEAMTHANMSTSTSAKFSAKIYDKNIVNLLCFHRLL